MDLTYHKKPMAFIAANPACTFEEFQKATGCNRQSWYDSRHRSKKVGIHRTGRPTKPETRFILNNPNATFEEFKESFGNNKREYVQARARAKGYMALRGLKDLIVPFRKKKGPKKPVHVSPMPEIPKDVFKRPSSQQEHLQTNYERDGVRKMEGTVSLGTTPEFIWYESTLIRNDFERTMNRFEHLVRVMESRQADNNKVLDQVLNENKRLRKEVGSLTDLLDARTKPGK